MSKWVDEVMNKEAKHEGSAVFEDMTGCEATLKVFPEQPKHLSVGVWWDGNDGEWTPEYLTVTLDRNDVKDLIATLTRWLETN